MTVAASAVPGVAIYGPEAPEFDAALTGILGRAPRQLLKPALPYSVIVENRSDRDISFLGVRFDLLGRNAQQCSVVHYADSLRNPEKGDFHAGAKRFVCAEPEYTALLIRGDVAPRTRGRMNLDNLRRMIDIRACLDCVAFADGEFGGPDSQKAFERLACERQVELAFASDVLAQVSQASSGLEAFLCRAVEDPEQRARRTIARKMLEALRAGGAAAVIQRAQGWRCRIPLWRRQATIIG